MYIYEISEESLDSPDVAVVGMAVRLPGALDVFDYWQNLKAGKESILRLSDEQLRKAGVEPDALYDPNYVKAAAIFDRLELFDAGFFGFSRREASVLDPQHRHFLEVCVEALEDAAIVPDAFDGAIGVFAGSGMNSYMPYNLFTNPELMRSMGLFLVRHTGNDKDFLTTRVSYCLDLKGPSVNVQTACSTSLVAIHLACQSLLAGECDVALAGGVTLELPHYRGYRYEEGEILSPDGHCRPFEERSKGTVFGSGAGVVVLKRLKDAIANGDFIHAVVKGTAVNNDGDRKVGYLAPSVDGQAECIVEALQVAGLTAREISYVECHGTGTPVGDPIEITALTQAFARTTNDKGFCGIGSVKSNIGHLDTAAGVASFVKVALMLEHEEQVPTLHFERPNPQIDFPATPFSVVAENRSWRRGPAPRRGGVSSLGVGGTNAHVIVEEAPRRKPVTGARPSQLLVLSTRSQASLDAFSARLARHFEEHPELELFDASSALLRGRRRFPHCRVLAASSLEEARALLATPDRARVFDAVLPGGDVPAVFLFPGGGAQHANMAREIYETEPKFREVMDECLAILKEQENIDLAPTLFPEPERLEQAKKEIERPSLALAALLAVEVAFARLLESWGVRPAAMIGHSLGEYAAAHLAGCISLKDALGIVCCRGRLFERVPPGGMLSVPLAAEELEPTLRPGLSIAAVNAPDLCVVSGTNAELEALQAELARRGVEARRLHIDVPAHSPLLAPILDEFRAYLSKVKFAAPKQAFISNLTGTFVGEGDLTPDYFVRHLSQTVRFSDGLAALLSAHPRAVLIEVGPGQTLASLARVQPKRGPEHAIVPLSPHVKDATSPVTHLVTSVGRVLVSGGAVDIDAFLGGPRRTVPLPPTPFEHERYWIEPGPGYFMARAPAAETSRESDVRRWFFTTSFREAPREAPSFVEGERWLVLAEGPLAHSLKLELQARGAVPITITPGERSGRLESGGYSLKLEDPQGYDDVLQAILAEGGPPRRILHALCLAADTEGDGELGAAAQSRCFYSLLYLAQVLGQEALEPGTELLVATERAYDVAGTSTLRPAHALAQGPVLVIPKEIPEIDARIFDVLDASDVEATARSLVEELSCPTRHALVADRGRTRYAGALERVSLEEPAPLALGEKPVVLVTGGLGGIGRVLAKHLAETRGARLVLVGRSRAPEASEWSKLRALLEPHDPRAEQLDFLIASQAAGLSVELETADVAEPEQARKLARRVIERHGKVDVLIHAAGVLDDAPLALKDRASCTAVFGPKLGARYLLDALAHEPPAFTLLLSSTSAALGPPGQIDYVAANAYVAALGRWANRRSNRSRVVSLGFGVWRDTGMAARAALPFVARTEGEPTGYPLLERERRTESDGLEFTSSFDERKLWVLDEHRVRGGSAVMPGTGAVEMARFAGARALGLEGRSGLELRDVLFLSPFEVPDGEVRLARTLVELEEEPPPSGGRTASTVATFHLASRGRDDRVDVEHARAIVCALRGERPEPLPLGDLRARCGLRTTSFEEGQQVLPQDQHLAFGPRWRVLREMCFGNGEALARLALPERFAADLDVFALPPGLLDMASGFAFSLADAEATERVRVPLSYQLLRLHAPLERELMSYVRLKSVSPDDGLAVFDVLVSNLAGEVLLEIRGYTTKSVPPAVLGKKSARDTESTLLERWSQQGITQPEGAAVLEHLLGVNALADIYASPTSLYDMLEQLQPKRATAQEAKTSAPAVKVGGSADEPRDDLERRLAEMWTHLLGVQAVGIRDNFFELGGHSLIAVRLFARIKKVYGVDLPLAVLFQAPTIETCAEVLRKELGIVFEPPKGSRPLGSSPRATQPERAFEHVVPIQKGNGRVPFFCVHGAGGNVLNFRSLSQHLGSAQPFYGLQAKGVTGEEPLRSIEEMARRYYEEIREVQPEGPYLLGGYSGGGVVAYEIAQRLRAAGEAVPLLVFFDTYHPSTRPRKPSFRERLEKVIAGGAGYLTRAGKGKLSRHFDELSTELKLMFFAANDLPLPLELRELQLARAFLEAAASYDPRPYDGRVLLLSARLKEDIYRHMGPTLGWQTLVPNLEIVEVPGGHDSLVLEPNVQVLTQHLAAAIDQAVRGRS